MARTAITKIDVVGPYPTLPIAANALDFALTAADVANGNAIAFGNFSRLLLVMQNTNAGAQTVTITTAPDDLNRTGDITDYSIGASEFAAIVVAKRGYRQDSGDLYIDASDAGILFAAFGIA